MNFFINTNGIGWRSRNGDWNRVRPPWFPKSRFASSILAQSATYIMERHMAESEDDHRILNAVGDICKALVSFALISAFFSGIIGALYFTLKEEDKLNQRIDAFEKAQPVLFTAQGMYKCDVGTDGGLIWKLQPKCLGYKRIGDLPANMEARDTLPVNMDYVSANPLKHQQ